MHVIIVCLYGLHSVCVYMRLVSNAISFEPVMLVNIDLECVHCGTQYEVQWDRGKGCFEWGN